MDETRATDLQRLQQENESLRQRLLDAQKMTALGELVGTTTHEFNNVLMTIINYAKMGIRHPDQPTRDKAFDKILAAGNRAAKITGSVLAVARNRSNQFETTDLRSLLDECLFLMERELQKYRIQVVCQFEDTPPVRAIGNQIQQVLINLLTNARQAMESGGQLIIKLAADPSTSTIDISVRDFGKGIPVDRLPRIFDAYFSTKDGPDQSGKGGTGLGLYACRNIIDSHGGKIRVESTVGKGTMFTIKLPPAKLETIEQKLRAHRQAHGVDIKAAG